MSTNRILKNGLAACAAVFLTAMAACSSGGRVNTSDDGLAIHGYDPVAYFTLERPTPGDATITYDYAGAVWRFASTKHRDAFTKNPERYAPAYGGFCAYAMARGSRADIDPAAWKIVNGKLYLNYDADIQAEWEADRSAMIARADRAWAELLARQAAREKDGK